MNIAPSAPRPTVHLWRFKREEFCSAAVYVEDVQEVADRVTAEIRRFGHAVERVAYTTDVYGGLESVSYEVTVDHGPHLEPDVMVHQFTSPGNKWAPFWQRDADA